MLLHRARKQPLKVSGANVWLWMSYLCVDLHLVHSGVTQMANEVRRDVDFVGPQLRASEYASPHFDYVAA